MALRGTPLRGSVLGNVVNGQAIRGVAMGERVHCECGDKYCTCKAQCTGLACYEWGSVDEGDWLYLCHRCALHFVKQPPVAKPEDVAS